MKTDQDKASAYLQGIKSIKKKSVQAFQFSVYRNPECLESLGSRMNLFISSPWLDRFNDCPQSGGCFNERLLPLFHNSFCNPGSGFFLPKLAQDVGESLKAVSVDDVGGCFLLAAIHPHVQRAFQLKAEAPLCGAELKHRRA